MTYSLTNKNKVYIIEEVEKMNRQSNHGDQRQFPVDEEDCKGNDDHGENLIHHADAESDEPLQQRYIADDVGDQFSCAVFFVETQGQALQMFENALTDVQQNPGYCICSQKSGNHAHGETDRVNRNQTDRQEKEQSPVFGRQNAVDHDFQHQRHGQCQT